MRRRTSGWSTLLVLFLLLGSIASLGASEEGSSKKSSPSVETEKRKLPNYDGRAEAPATAGEVVLWIPRVVFFPIYLVTEYLLRAPIGLLASSAEKSNWPAAVISFFTFG